MKIWALWIKVLVEISNLKFAAPKATGTAEKLFYSISLRRMFRYVLD